jgi:uncharacterized protein (TIGR00369 family)
MPPQRPTGFVSFGPDATQPEDLRTLALRVLVAQPFSELLGTRLGRVQRGAVELRLSMAPFLFQQSGFVHGGVLAYLADAAITFAAGTVLGRDVVTADVKLNYLRPARGAELLAQATVVHVGQLVAVCRCDVVAVETDGTRTTCVAAQGSALLARAATKDSKP